jgi:hypothetical protein
MEIDDLLKLSEDVRKYLKSTNNMSLDLYKKLEKREKKVQKLIDNGTHQLIHDLPTPQNIGNYEIGSSRYPIRIVIMHMYHRIRDDLYEINETLKTKIFDSHSFLGIEHIDSVLADKTYIETIINKGIFNYDDIWIKTFKDPNIYDKLLKGYSDYLDLYEKQQLEKKEKKEKKTKKEKK